MTCSICSSILYEKSRNELTVGTFVSIRCSKKGCPYHDYKNTPIIIPNSTTGE